MRVVLRGIASALAVGAWALANVVMDPVAVLGLGEAAARQFEPSDVAYLASHLEVQAYTRLGLSFVLVLMAWALIWWPRKPRPGAGLNAGVVALLGAGAFAGAPSTAQAYYDINNLAEAYFILPNQSAFYVPDVGANKSSQTQMDSEAYFAENKVSAKRFEIPHVKFSGSGTFKDYYVPAGRLILVDRTPYNREWTHSSQRGTASKDESLPCQSSEGLNITTELTVGAAVRPENAAKFLYYFGVTPPQGNPQDPNVIFASVYRSRSLAEVMDTVGRGKIQSLVCAELTSRTVAGANGDAARIIGAVQQKAAEFFAARGITLDYVGWAGTFTFDHAVQKAINDRFVALTLSDAVGPLQKLADISVKEGLGEGLRKGLPSLMPAGLNDWFSGIFRNSATPVSVDRTPRH